MSDLLSKAEIKYIGVSRKRQKGLTFVEDYSQSPVGDILVHLAESNNRREVNKHGEAYELETANLLGKLTQKRFRKIIYASSSVLYGDQSNTPRKETEPLFVYDSYTRVKHLSEHLVTANNGTILRFSNLYGKGMSDKNVMSSILNQVKGPGPIALRSTSPVRDFLWVEDAAKAILQTIQNDLTGIYNVGSGIGTSIGVLASLFFENIGRKNHQIISGNENETSSNLVLDISKIVQATDWSPQTSLKKGISELLNNTN